MKAVIGALRAVLGLETAAFDKGVGESVKGLNQLSRQFSNTAKQFNSIGKTMSVSITAPIAAWRALSLKTGSDFEDAMIKVRKATGATAEQISALSGLARELGTSTGIGALKAAGVIEELGKRGVSFKDTMEGAAEATIKLAKANGGDLAPAAELTERLMTAFNITARELPKTMEDVTATVQASRLTFDDYKSAVDAGATVLSRMGVSFKDFNTGLALTSQGFASGAEAAASFRMFLMKLSPDSKDAKEAMQQLGLNFFDAKGAFIGLEASAALLNKQLGHLSDKSRIEVMNKIFGRRAMNTALVLTREGAAGVQNMRKEIDQLGEQKTVSGPESLSLAMKRLSAQFQELQISVAQTGLIDWAVRMTKAFTELVKLLNAASPATLKFAVTLTSIAAAIGPLALGIGTIAKGFASIGGLIARVAPALAGVAVAAGPWLALAAAVVAVVAGLVLFSDQIVVSQAGNVTLADYLGATVDYLKSMVAWTVEAALALDRWVRGVDDAGARVSPTIGSIGDKFAGLGDVISNLQIGAALYNVFVQPLDTVLNLITGFVAATIVAFGRIGPACGDLLTQAANVIVGKLAEIVNAGIEKLNVLRRAIGNTELPLIAFTPWANENAGAAEKAGQAIAMAFAQGFSGSLIKETIAGISRGAQQTAMQRQLAKIAQDALIGANDPKGIGGTDKPKGGTGGGDSIDLGHGGKEHKTAAEKLKDYITGLGRQVELERMANTEKAIAEALDKARAIATEGKIKLQQEDIDTITEYVKAEEKAKEATTERQRLETLGKKVTEDSKTAQEKYNAALADLDKLLAMSLISQDTYKKASKILREELAKDSDGLESKLEQVSTAVTDAAKSAAEELFNTDKSFGDVLRSMLDKFRTFALQMFLFEPLFKHLGDMIKSVSSSAFSTGGSGGGGIGGMIGGWLGKWFGSGSSGAGGGGIDAEIANWSSYGGPKASGGNVSPGQWYSVNEAGIEAFVPNVPGKIIPNRDLASVMGDGGGARVVNQHFEIKTPDADSFRKGKRQVQRQMKRAAGV